MSLLTIEQFAAILNMPDNRASIWYPQVVVAMDEFEINSPLRISHFLAQVGHESGSFKYVKEIWTNSLAQQGYEGAARLGNSDVGDGERYLGRGPMQITGRKNYAALSVALDINFISQPQLLERIDYGARSACWFWKAGAGKNLGHAALSALEKYDSGVGVNLNDVADADDIVTITLCINGGMNGFEERSRILLQAFNVLGDSPATWSAS